MGVNLKGIKVQFLEVLAREYLWEIEFIFNYVDGSRPMSIKVDYNTCFSVDTCSYQSIPIPTKKTLKMLAQAPTGILSENKMDLSVR